MQENRDKLIAFAAGKLNVEIEAVKERRYFEQTYPPDSTEASTAFSYQEIVPYYVIAGTKSRFDLTSPELFLKGLGVLIREGVEFLIEPGYVHVAIPDNTVSAPVKEIADLPLKFWTAWAELEGGQG